MKTPIIREWEIADAADLSAALSDQKVLDNLRDGLPYPYTEKDAADYINFVRSADKSDAFVFAVTADNKAIGNVGAFRQSNVHRLSAEIGYYLAQSYWGKGIMTETVKELCDYVFSNTDIVRIYGEVFSDNVGSCRVLEKAGFTCEGVLRSYAVKNGEIKDVKIYAIVKKQL